MTFLFSLIKDLKILLDKELKRIYFVAIVFVLSSSLDLIGLGLIGAYIAFIVNPDGFRELESLSYFNDFLSSSTDQELLVFFGLILVFIFLIRLLAILLSNYIIYKFSADQMVKVQERMMDIYLNQDYESFIQRNSSEYVVAISTYVRRYRHLLSSMLKIFSDLLVFIAVVSALAIVDLVTLGVLIFLFLAMFILFNKFLYSKVQRYGEKFNLADRLMIKGISEGVSGMKEIRILGKEDFFKKTFSRVIKTMAELDVKEKLIQSSPKSLLELIMVVFVVIIVFMNFYIQDNLDTVVTVLGVFAVGAVRLVPIVGGLFSSINTVKYGRSSVSHLVKDIQSFETGGSKTIESKDTTLQQQSFLDLDISSISYSYPNSGEKALEDISLKIKKGDFVGFVGPSGAGKTTLVDVLLGLLHPQTGTIKLNGKDIFSQIELWRSLVAYLPQEIFLIDDSLAKNIALDDDIENSSHDRFKEVVIKSRLDDFIDNLPEGLDTRMGERGVRLSGGQRQRVAIARALFHEREVLILDEATSSLDMKTEEEIVKQIQQFKGEKTVITIAHRISSLKYCDSLYKLEKGTILGPYTYDDFLLTLKDKSFS